MSSMHNIIKYLAEIKILTMRLETIGYIDFDRIKLTNEEEKILDCKETLQKILDDWKSMNERKILF